MNRLAVALVALTASFSGLAFFSFGERDSQLRQDIPAPPQVTPAAVARLFAQSLPDLDGRPQSLEQWRGKVLVVNYWASWCQPCRKEMPHLSTLHGRLAARGVQVVGIAADTAEPVRNHVRTMPVAYPLLIGGPEAIRLTRDFGNTPQAVPLTIVIDRAGQVRAAVLGITHEDALERLLLSLL